MANQTSVIPNENKINKSTITEIDCTCGAKMKRFSVIAIHGEEVGGIICDKTLANGKKCGRTMIGSQEFFQCQHPDSQKIHNQQSFDCCLVCAGVISKEEITRTKQTTVIQQAMHIANMYEKQINSDDENDLIVFATFLQHKTLNSEKASEYFKKALNIINGKLDHSDDEEIKKKLISKKFEALCKYGAVLHELKQCEEAQKQYECGIKLYNTDNNKNNEIIGPQIYANLLCNYGRLLRALKKFDAASNKFKLGINVLIENNEHEVAAFLCNSYALMLEQDLNNYDLASDYFLKAIEYNELIESSSGDNVMMANDYDQLGFKPAKKKFLFQENYIVFLKNVERLNSMEKRINLMIKRYNDFIINYEKHKDDLNVDNKENEEENINNKYVLSKLYIYYAQSVMRHHKLNEKDIINGENYLKLAIKLNINERNVYSACALYLEIISLRISDQENDKIIAFPFNKKDAPKEDYDISEKLKLLVFGYIRIFIKLSIPLDIKVLIGYFMYEWKQSYNFSSRIDDIKKYYNLAIKAKLHIDLKAGLKFFNEPPKTIKEQNISLKRCVDHLHILQKKAKEEKDPSYWFECKSLCEWFLVLCPNNFEVHLIYAISLYQYGGLLNYDLALIHFQIGLILLQYVQNQDYRNEILLAVKQNEYKALKNAIEKIRGTHQRFENEIERIKQIKNDNDLMLIYTNYGAFLANELRDSWKSAKTYKLAYDLNNNDYYVCFNYAIILHQLNSDRDINFIELKKEFGDYNYSDALFKKSISLLHNEVLIEQAHDSNEFEAKQGKKTKKKETEFSRLAVKYILEMRQSKRELKDIELMYDYLLQNYYQERDQETLSYWIDFQFHYLQFLILHHKDEKAYKMIKICEKYSLKFFRDSSTNAQFRFVIVTKVAESYSLIDKHVEWQLLMDKCMSEENIIKDEPIHNVTYYYGYLYETSLRDYKKAMLYYNKAMELISRDMNAPGAKEYYAMYSAVYANCLRIVKKDYKTCEIILKQAISMVGSPDGVGAICYNMYEKYLKEMEKIKNNPNYGGIDHDEITEKEPERNNQQLREMYAMGHWLKGAYQIKRNAADA